MDKEITIEASDVWGYFCKHKDELSKFMHQIAENKEYGTVVFVTEESGLPSIVVTADGAQVYEEMAVSESDCAKTVRKIYEDYLTDKVIATLGDEGGVDLTEMEIEDMITEREDELDLAVMDFMTVALDGYVDDNSPDFDDICSDLKEHFLEYMARKHGLLVRRPMWLEYEDGTEEFEEYPYENMEFDDEDNPIYK